MERRYEPMDESRRGGRFGISFYPNTSICSPSTTNASIYSTNLPSISNPSTSISFTVPRKLYGFFYFDNYSLLSSCWYCCNYIFKQG